MAKSAPPCGIGHRYFKFKPNNLVVSVWDLWYSLLLDSLYSTFAYIRVFVLVYLVIWLDCWDQLVPCLFLASIAIFIAIFMGCNFLLELTEKKLVKSYKAIQHRGGMVELNKVQLVWTHCRIHELLMAWDLLLFQQILPLFLPQIQFIGLACWSNSKRWMSTKSTFSRSCNPSWYGIRQVWNKTVSSIYDNKG